ncbi:MAG TPA: type 4a pilus biogenesis protein PilO [Candidatus Saccharimonadales bacterium]|jgi:Tfp pilus assembly protein PilO
MKIKNLFSSKRQAIDQAKSSVMAMVVMASIIISFSVVTINFLWNLRSYNSRVQAEKSQALSTLRQNVDNGQQLKTQFEIFEDGDINSQDVLSAMPSKYDYAALITSVDVLAKRSGMFIDSFVGTDESETAAQSSVNPEPVEISFSITVKGRYDDLQKFIDNLDRSIRPMKINSISISGSDNNISAELAMTTYYQPQASIDVEEKVVQ